MSDIMMQARRLATLLVLCLCACTTPTAHAGIVEDFDGPAGLVAAEGLPPSGPWQLTSGSLFRDAGTGWTGTPNESTGSAVFRMVSVERDFGDLYMSLALQVNDLVTTSRTPAQDYDGAHIWVRYRSDRELYAVSLDRRDGTITIKKKCEGGPDNGGTYYDLNGYQGGAPIPFGAWQDIRVGVRDQPDGSVRITASRDGLHMEAVDSGIGCAPLRRGGVGIRGDNAEMRFRRIRVD
jgi:hypothetical protein